MQDDHSGWVEQFLTSGAMLRRGARVNNGHVGVRLIGDIELTDRPENLARLGRELFERFSGQAFPAGIVEPRVVITGNPVDGFTFYGPSPLEDTDDGYRDARTRRLELDGDEWWLAPLRPLSDLVPLDGDDRPPMPVTTAEPFVDDRRAKFLRATAELRALDAEAACLREEAHHTGEPNGLSAVLRQAEDLTRVALRLAEDLLGDGSEPAEHMQAQPVTPDRNPWAPSPTDKHVPKPGQQYITTHVVGRPDLVNSYAFVGGELIEAHDTNDDGSPNWRDASLCDPIRGEEAFFYPAAALLRFLNEDEQDMPLWHFRDREDAETALTQYADLGLIADWGHHAPSGGYTVVTHGAPDDWTLRTPDMADSFTAAMRSALASGGEQIRADVARRGDPAVAAAMWVVISDALAALRDNLGHYEVRPWETRESGLAMPAALTERSGYETLLTAAEAFAADNAGALVSTDSGAGQAAPPIGATEDVAGGPLVVEDPETAG